MYMLHVVFNQGDVWDIYFKTWNECMTYLVNEVYPWAVEKGYPLIQAYCTAQ